MSIVEIEGRGRVTIPKEMRLGADRALVIPMGDSYMIVQYQRRRSSSMSKKRSRECQTKSGEEVSSRGQVTRFEEAREMIIESDLFMA
jgi:virulence-associated protein VagC